MSEHESIPNRTREADTVEYALLSRESFKDCVVQFSAMLETELKTKISYGIDVRGFDGTFENIDRFVSTISDSEWLALRSITVRFYSEPYSKYGLLMGLGFGEWHLSDSGLEISYGTKMTNIEYVAIKMQSDRLISAYSRHIALRRNVTAYALSAIVVATTYAVFALNHLFGIKFKENPSFADWCVALIAICWFSYAEGGLVYLLVSMVYRKLLPNFEIVDQSGRTRFEIGSKRIAWGVGAIGLLGSILGIYQFLQNAH